MFQNDKRYITRGIQEQINEENPLVYLELWKLIDEMDIEEKDYLQVFELRAVHGIDAIQEIEHTQEQPPYRKIYRYYTDKPVNAKIYVIDDGDHSTMLLSEEY